LVLRLCEYRGLKTDVDVLLPARFKSAQKVNLLEREGKQLSISANRIRVALRPWEICTLRFEI